MKKLISPILAAIILVGCTTPISDATLNRIQIAAQGAAAVGVAASLIAAPATKPIILEIQSDLDVLASSPSPTSAQLVAIVAGRLPLGDKAQYVYGALVLWGVTEGFWVAPNSAEAVRMAARGFSLGITQGISATNIKSGYTLAALEKGVSPPAPTKKNIKKV